MNKWRKRQREGSGADENLKTRKYAKKQKNNRNT
jgi:hypothetical protein